LVGTPTLEMVLYFRRNKLMIQFCIFTALKFTSKP